MTIEDSSVLGMALGSAGEISVLMWAAINRSWGRSIRKLLSCSSRAVAGDLQGWRNLGQRGAASKGC
jgi:hypothetical protein